MNMRKESRRHMRVGKFMSVKTRRDSLQLYARILPYAYFYLRLFGCLLPVKSWFFPPLLSIGAEFKYL